jgi:hypothetical protein
MSLTRKGLALTGTSLDELDVERACAHWHEQGLRKRLVCGKGWHSLRRAAGKGDYAFDVMTTGDLEMSVGCTTGDILKYQLCTYLTRKNM